MIKQSIGRIQQVEDIRVIFENEALDFTPWLNENLDILTRTLNLEIVENEIEKSVGDFSCDIVGRDETTSSKLIIENQFGATDHDHLGKVFTYAAGVDAGVVIWIAEKFREEHKKALEWLNESVDPNSGLSFFGVELRIIKIENSPPAPDFNVVVKPNNWERNVKIASRPNSERAQKYAEFFSKLTESWNKVRPNGMSDPRPRDYYLTISAGRSDMRYAWTFSRDVLLVEFVVKNDEDRKLYNEFMKYKEEIEKKIGNLTWQAVEETKRWKIFASKRLKGDIMELSVEDHAEIIDWSTITMRKFVDVFSLCIKRIR